MNDNQSTEALWLTARLNEFHNQMRDGGAGEFDAHQMLEWLRETYMDDLIAYLKKDHKEKLRQKDEDRDGDGVPDYADCEPDNPNKQDNLEVLEVDDFLARQTRLKPSQADVPVTEIELQDVPKTESAFSKVFKAGKKAGATAVKSGESYLKTRADDKKQLQALSNEQLKQKAIATEESFFGGNKYKTELLRRIQARKKLDKELQSAEAKEQSGDSLFG